MVLGGVNMKVTLMGHTQLTESFFNGYGDHAISDGQAIALTAIRTCYSHNKPSEIVELEGEKYFGQDAKDGEGGTDADRLIRHIIKSGHTSTMEHLTFTFAIEGVSRSLLAQLTRHRHFSYSVQSQRYVKLESDSKSGGFDYVTPPNVDVRDSLEGAYSHFMEKVQEMYDELRNEGVPAEDARYILPNAATCNLVLTGNLRSILDFYSKRSSKQAQWEIRELADQLKQAVVKVEKWTEAFFE
jgi:thymidylate synthase (FAD)